MFLGLHWRNQAIWSCHSVSTQRNWALRATPSQGFVTRNQRRRRRRRKRGGRKKKERNRREREFNPLSGTSRMDVSASLSAQKFEGSVASRHTGVVVALRLCASLHWKWCVCVCVCVCACALRRVCDCVCARPQPTSAVRITAGTWEGLKNERKKKRHTN